ncbi:TlpA family protein disulfide reductase [Bacteroides thetaiotaomicron]|nr:TlpA family protein disulfide reductase [Bacteroides thetaiotaomicron]
MRKYRWTVFITCQLQKQSHTNQFHRHWLWQPCQAAVPFLKKLKELFSNEEFDLIAIESWSHNASAIRNYAKRKDLNYTILNATNKVIKQYQTGGAAPFFFILDQKRIIRKIIRGYSTENTDKEIINAIKELL